MRLQKRHLVVVKKADGTPEVARMKEWLRNHPKDLPAGMDASGKPSANSSHELRSGLKRNGWILDERGTQVFVIKPDEDGDISYAHGVLAASGGAEEGVAVAAEVTEAREITFGLERDLQQALRKNIQQLEPGLTIIDGGCERETDAGRIDVTARDIQGNIVVIELKAGPATPEVISQILAYMGALAETENKPVRGILVAGDFHSRVRLAARAVPNLMLKRYSFQFTFETLK